MVPEAEWDKVQLGYILLPRDLDRVDLAPADWSEDDLSLAYATADDVIRKLRSEQFVYDPDTKSYRDDELNALLGRLGLPQADDDDDGEADE